MNGVDYAVLFGVLLGIAGYGMWRTRHRRDLSTYVKGHGTSRWLVIGLSVMATQASAITFLSTPGQGYTDGLGFVQKMLKDRTPQRGPSDEKRANTRSHIWGEVRNGAGREVKMELDTPNGYDITVTASLGIVEHLMQAKPAGGYYTPSQLMGAEYVLGLPGVQLTKSAA